MFIPNNLIVTKLKSLKIEMLIKNPLSKFVYLNNRYTFKYINANVQENRRNSPPVLSGKG